MNILANRVKKKKVKIGTAKVKYDPDKVSETEIVSAIEQAGYKVVG